MRPLTDRAAHAAAATRKTLRLNRRASERRAEILALEPRVLLSAVLHPHAPPAHPRAHLSHPNHSSDLLGAAKKPATTTTALTAPSSLTAASSGASGIHLNWKDNCTTASGYYVLRSTGGGAFTTLTTIGSSTASS